jgi:uncharacterized protein (TIGR02145 family)
MKNTALYFTIAIAFTTLAGIGITGCTHLLKTKNGNNSFIADSVNNYPSKIMLDNKQWMTANLNVNMPGSYCYDDVATNCDKYGRLYTWEAAKKACEILGNGWRLPTDEEWQQLAAHYGGAHKDSMNTGKAAYKALLQGGFSKFNVVLGGNHFSGNYTRLEAHGFYWTATEKDTVTALFYNFGKGSQNLYRQEDGEKSRTFSVRCIK